MNHGELKEANRSSLSNFNISYLQHSFLCSKFGLSHPSGRMSEVHKQAIHVSPDDAKLAGRILDELSVQERAAVCVSKYLKQEKCYPHSYVLIW